MLSEDGHAVEGTSVGLLRTALNQKSRPGLWESWPLMRSYWSDTSPCQTLSYTVAGASAVGGGAIWLDPCGGLFLPNLVPCRRKGVAMRSGFAWEAWPEPASEDIKDMAGTSELMTCFCLSSLLFSCKRSTI